MIYLGNMNAVNVNVDLTSGVVDPGTVTVQPGATWRNVIDQVSKDLIQTSGPSGMQFSPEGDRSTMAQRFWMASPLL